MDISYARTVAVMGELDAHTFKAKDKWQKTKAQSTCIVAGSVVSGNSNVQCAAGYRDYSLSNEEMSYITVDSGQ